jgi:hypothetical protein
MNISVGLLATFPVVRYRVDAVVDNPIQLPDFSGSLLRGVLGHALREALCVTGKESCNDCPLYRSCDFPVVFDAPPPLNAERLYADIPQAYVIEPPLGERFLRQGDILDFGFVLMGPALVRFALIASAWQRALRRPIAGRNGGTARLQSIGLEDGRVAFDGGRGVVAPHPQQLVIPPIPDRLSAVTLAFRTPLNLRHQGRYLGPEDIGLQDLLRALIRRITCSRRPVGLKSKPSLVRRVGSAIRIASGATCLLPV